MKHLFRTLTTLLVLCLVGCGPDPEEPAPETIDPPTGLKVTTTTTTTIALQWNIVEGAEGYEVRCKNAAGYTTTPSSTTTVTLSGLTEATEYQVAVRAKKGSLVSPFSEYITAKTAAKEEVGGGGNDDQGGGGNDNTGGDDNTGGNGGNDDTGGDNTGGDDNTGSGGEVTPSANTLAFPGAEGGGMYTTGGRGGKVYHVTNLNDSGAGSFREAVGKSGPRTIVFDVAGTIHLKSTLRINNGNLTIAGQTAPGDGICIAGRTVQVSASNIIIRYVRFRLGNEDKSQEDAIWGRYNSDIILDHCSMSWSIDEACSFYANKNFTMQWCVVSEALKNAGHTKGAHGYGGIWGGRNASFHHNLLAHNDSRNPRFDHPEVYDNYVSTHRGNADYRNNVVYNWGGNSTYGGEGAAWNVVGNYYKPGPASSQRKYFVDANGIYNSSKTDYGYARMYVSGNYHAGSYAASINSDNWSGIYLHDGTKPSNHNSWKSSSPLPIRKDDSQQCYTTTHTAQQAYEQVLAYVGASLRRDAVDSRVVGNVRNGNYSHKGSNGGTNGIIDSHTDVGGWPTLSATSAEVAKVKDTDGDGMPDSWESAKGLNPNSPTDGTTNTLNPSEGYTNLEIYLAELVENITNNQNQKGTYTTLN